MAASQTIGAINVSVTATTERFRKQMMSARKTLGGFVKSVEKTIFSMKSLAAVMAGGAFANAISRQMQSIDSLAKTADKLGIATEALAGLRLAAEESGVASNTLDMALQRMVRRVAEAAQGTGEAQSALKELGLNAKTLANLSPDEQFRRIAEAMNRVGSQADKVRLAFKLFDSEGVALVNTLKLGRAGLDEAAQAAQDLGIAIDRETAAGVERAIDAFNRFKSAVAGIFRQVAITIAPLLEGMSASITKFLSQGGRAQQVGQFIGKALAAMADAGQQAFAKFMRFIAMGVDMLNHVRSTNGAAWLGFATPTADELGLSQSLRNRAYYLEHAKNRPMSKAYEAIEGMNRNRVAAALGSQSIANFGQRQEAAAAEAPVNNVTSLLGKIAEDTKARAKRFAMEKGFQAKLYAKMATMVGKAVVLGAKRSQGEALNNASMSAIEANSREGFSQRVRAMRNDPNLRIQKSQLAQLQQIANNTRNRTPVLPANL